MKGMKDKAAKKAMEMQERAEKKATEMKAGTGGSSTHVVQIVVPKGIKSGSTIRVQVEGNAIDVKIPRGVKGGQTMNIEVPGAPPSAVKEEEAPTPEGGPVADVPVADEVAVEMTPVSGSGDQEVSSEPTSLLTLTLTTHGLTDGLTD